MHNKRNKGEETLSQWPRSLLITLHLNVPCPNITEVIPSRTNQLPLNIFWMYSINLFLFRSHTQPPLFLLHRSPLVSSSAWGLVMPRAFTRVRARNQHQIFKQVSIVDLPRILLVLSRLVPTQAKFLVLSLRSPQLLSSESLLKFLSQFSCARSSE